MGCEQTPGNSEENGKKNEGNMNIDIGKMVLCDLYLLRLFEMFVFMFVHIDKGF